MKEIHEYEHHSGKKSDKEFDQQRKLKQKLQYDQPFNLHPEK